MFFQSHSGQSCRCHVGRTLSAIALVLGLSSSALAEVEADFNGDGFDDLAIGVPFDAESGVYGAGAVNVLYGSAAGLQATGLGGPNDQLWHQGVTGVEGSPGQYDGFGEALATGDFNNDGFDDLAIGVPGKYTRGVGADTGVVNVLYGSAAGLQASGLGGPVDQLWHQDSPGVLGTAEADDRFGSALVADDFNGDGYDDLAVGVPGESIGSASGAGAVNVLYGSAAGLQATGFPVPDDQWWHQDVTGVQGTADAWDRFGSTLTTGDFNSDGCDDLVIGAPYEYTSNLQWAGAVHVLYGSLRGLQANGQGGPDDELWHQDVSGVQNSAGAWDLFGSALAAGDFNSDGFDDLAIGVMGEDPSFSGAVHVLYGWTAGLQATGVGSSPDDQLWSQDSSGVVGAGYVSDWFGDMVGVGDFNNDGFDDLAITSGDPGDGIGPTGAGAENVLYGSPVGLQALGISGPDDQLWHQEILGVQGTGEGNDQFGKALFAADFNNDGYDDLAIGVPEDQVSGHAYGAVNVLYGSYQGLQALGLAGPDDQLWHQDVTGVEGNGAFLDAFGGALPGSASIPK